jgi:hypothetical protein
VLASTKMLFATHGVADRHVDGAGRTIAFGAISSRVFLTSEYPEYVAAQAEAYWLLDEIALAQRYEKSVASEEFQLSKLKVNPDHMARLACEDGTATPSVAKRSSTRIVVCRRSRCIHQQHDLAAE